MPLSHLITNVRFNFFFCIKNKINKLLLGSRVNQNNVATGSLVLLKSECRVDVKNGNNNIFTQQGDNGKKFIFREDFERGIIHVFIKYMENTH